MATRRVGFLCFATAIVFLLCAFTVSANWPVEEKPSGNVNFAVVKSSFDDEFKNTNSFVPKSHLSIMEEAANFLTNPFPFNLQTFNVDEKIKGTMATREEKNNLDTMALNGYDYVKLPLLHPNYQLPSFPYMMSSLFDSLPSLSSNFFPMSFGPSTKTEIDYENQVCVVTVNSTNLPDSSQVEVLVYNDGLITINYLNSESNPTSFHSQPHLRGHDAVDEVRGFSQSHNLVEVSSSNSFTLEDRCDAQHEQAKSMVDKNQGVIKLKFPLKETSSNNNSSSSSRLQSSKELTTTEGKPENVDGEDLSKVSQEDDRHRQQSEFRLPRETPRVLPRVRYEEF